MMKKFYLISLLLVSCMQAFAQDTFQGLVKNNENQPLLRAQVKVFDADENLLTTVFTDAEGKFVTDIEIGRVTGIDDPWSGNYYLSLIYPNPASKGPIHFKYRSVTGEQPHITFYTFKGDKIHAGATISAGTYIYKAVFTDTEEKALTGLFSVLSSMKLEVQLQDISQPQNDKLASSKNTNAARVAAMEQVRIEIIKDEYITLSEEVDLTLPENGDQTYSLNEAEKPTADFQIIADEGKAEGNLIKFDASASAGANDESLIYSWSFDDGGRGGQVQVPHIFTTPDTYTVSLTVVGAYGAKQSVTKDISINAYNPTTGIAAIRGIVSDARGNPLEGVTVQVPHMDTTFMTISNGEVGFDGFVSGKPRMLILSKPGYVSEHYALDILAESKQGYFELSLVAQEPAIVLENAELGGVVGGKDGGSVQLPVEALMHQDGSMVTGEVEVFVTPVDISDDLALKAFPGNFSGITFDGEAPLIMTYGTADYTFMQNGEELQLVSGKTATIDIPIYADVDELGESLSEGDEFPLWYYDEASGNWIMEGTGIVVSSGESPTGLALRGEVMHFTWWNHDIAPEPWFATPKCKIEDKNGLPTLELPKNSACFIEGGLAGSGGAGGPQSNRSTPNCCNPLPSPPGVPIIFNGSAGNGIYSGSTTASGGAGTTSTVIISMKRIASYGETAGIIAPDTLFNTTIETADNIDAFTIEGTGHVGEEMLLSVSQASGSNLEGAVELRDPDNLLLYKGEFASGKSFQALVEIKKEGDYQVIVSGTANAPGVYTVSLTNTRVITLNSNTDDTQVLPQGSKSFVMELDSGQLYNVAMFTKSISGRSYLNLYNPTGERIFRDRGENYIETDVQQAVESGVYTIIVEGVDNDSDGDFTIGLASIDEPIPLTLKIPYTQAEGEITIIGDKHYYTFDANAYDQKNVALHTPGALTAKLTLRGVGTEPFYDRKKLADISNSNFDDRPSYRWNYLNNYERTLPESGDYILEIESGNYQIATTRTGPYEIFVLTPEIKSITINSEVSDSLRIFLGQIPEFKQYTFEANADDIVNVAYKDNIIGRNYIRLLDSEMNEISSIRDGQQLRDPQMLPTTGTYNLLFEGVDVADSEGDYIIGLTSVEEPEPITFEAPFITIDDKIEIIGKHKYYSFNVDSLERFVFGLKGADTLSAYLNFTWPFTRSDKPYYEMAANNYSLNTYEGSVDQNQRYQMSMPYGGEMILEFDPGNRSQLETDDGGYQIYIGQRAIVPIALNTSIGGSISPDLGLYRQFHRYQITSPASNQISVDFAWDNPPTDLGRIYISVFSLEGEQLYSQLEFESSVITLPASGNYIVEIESVDSNEGGFSLIVNEE